MRLGQFFLDTAQILDQRRLGVEFFSGSDTNVRRAEVLARMLLENLLNTLDFNMLNTHIRISSSRQRHEQGLFEKVFLPVRAKFRTNENFQYVLEICNCHYLLSFDSCRAASRGRPSIITHKIRRIEGIFIT